ncbi:hypothetical protein M1349_04975 [Patescibacteria group bacterium]|nr:hypothetical protein [Patescibacteria group bacterium]
MHVYHYLVKIFFNFLSSIFQLIFFILFPQKTTESTPTGKPLRIAIDVKSPLYEISDKYLSFAVDTSKALGGYWWGSSGVIEIGKGKEKTIPLDFTNEKLITFANALSPAYFRVGGTEADNVLFDLETKEDHVLHLTKQKWNTINNFVSKAKLDLFYTVNASPLVRDPDKSWNNKNFERLLQYSKKKGYEIAAFELGNELNAYWFFHGFFSRVTPKQYIKDFLVFRTVAKKYYPNTLVGGSASLYWPRIGEALSFVGSFLPTFIKNIAEDADMFTWHYYPQQSRRSPLTFPKAKSGLLLQPRYLNDIIKWAKKLTRVKNTSNSNSEMWIGEIGHAMCGGQSGISDTFESSLWWTDVLGSMAANDQKVVVRQDLVGSDYSLLDEETLNPRPDFWVSLLWKKLMGTNVFGVRISTDNDYIRVYAHSVNQKLGYSQDSITIVCINLQNKKNELYINDLCVKKALVYELTAEKLDSKSVMLNGERLIVGNTGIPSLEGKEMRTTNNLFKLAPLSITFLVFPHEQ